jgi:predicted RNA-binding Zn-ribbon protein involved in translation (DUF1610 family)
MSIKICPACGLSVHRSHARGWKEKLVRAVSPYRPYRCHDCGWRGWFGKSNTILSKNRQRTIVSLLITIFITTLLALYLIDRMTAPVIPVETKKTAR